MDQIMDSVGKLAERFDSMEKRCDAMADTAAGDPYNSGVISIKSRWDRLKGMGKTRLIQMAKDKGIPSPDNLSEDEICLKILKTEFQLRAIMAAGLA